MRVRASTAEDPALDALRPQDRFQKLLTDLSRKYSSAGRHVSEVRITKAEGSGESDEDDADDIDPKRSYLDQSKFVTVDPVGHGTFWFVVVPFP